MIEQAGATFTLSFLLVILAALVLYRPDPPLSVAVIPVSEGPTSPTRPAEGPSRPNPGSDSRPLVTRPLQEERSEPSENPQADRVETSPGVATTIPDRSLSEAFQRPGGTRRPESSFTTVEPGEDLDAVAARVYGPAGDPQALWRVNRDLIARPDTPLQPGMVLRTPTLD